MSFVDTRGDDPARDFIESLLTQLPARGPVIVAAHRERPVLVWLGQSFADMAEGMTGIIARLLELHPVGGPTRPGILERPSVYVQGMMAGALGDDIDAADAYRELIGPSRRQVSRRSCLTALIEYGERQTTSLWRMVSQDSGVLIPPDPHWPAAGGRGFVLN